MLTAFQKWLGRPYSAEMDAFHWFLFFGLISVIAVIWSIILRAIRE